MAKKCRFLVAAGFFCVSLALFASGPVVLPTASVFRIECPASGAGAGWISSETDLTGEFPLGVDAFRSVLMDYVAYPRVFPRLVKTTVLASNYASATIRQQYEFNVLGRHYPTVYELALSIDDTAYPSRWMLSWALAGTDGTVAESRGCWILEDIGTAEEPATRVTHRNKGLVKKKIPLQERVMRSSVERELSRLMVAIYDEANERQSRDNQLALAR